MHVKDLKSYKGQSPHQQKLLFPTENTAPEMPLSALSPLVCDFVMSVTHQHNLCLATNLALIN